MLITLKIVGLVEILLVELRNHMMHLILAQLRNKNSKDDDGELNDNYPKFLQFEG